MQHFTDLHNFLLMGGYAQYVWPAYGVTALVLIWNLILAWLHGKHDSST